MIVEHLEETADVLQVQDLTKRRGSDYTLGPLSFTLKRGYIYALMGPNGSGKSTLFKMLYRLVHADEGRMAWFGGDSADVDLLDVKRRVGMVPDQLDVPDENWTLRECAAVMASWQPRWNQKRYADLVYRYELDEHKKLRKLSKGQRAKAAFLLALAQDPEVLLLDEPTSGVDPFAWRLMIEDLGAFMESGEHTIVMATHILDEIRKLADYVMFLHEGKLLGIYEKDALASEWRMFWVEGPPPIGEQLPGVVTMEQEIPVKLISSDAARTEAALQARGMAPFSQRPLEIDEIFAQ